MNSKTVCFLKLVRPELHHARIHNDFYCVPKSITPSSIDNFVNSQRNFNILSLADFLENLRQNYH